MLVNFRLAQPNIIALFLFFLAPFIFFVSSSLSSDNGVLIALVCFAFGLNAVKLKSILNDVSKSKYGFTPISWTTALFFILMLIVLNQVFGENGLMFFTDGVDHGPMTSTVIATSLAQLSVPCVVYFLYTTFRTSVPIATLSTLVLILTIVTFVIVILLIAIGRNSESRGTYIDSFGNRRYIDTNELV